MSPKENLKKMILKQQQQEQQLKLKQKPKRTRGKLARLIKKFPEQEVIFI